MQMAITIDTVTISLPVNASIFLIFLIIATVYHGKRYRKREIAWYNGNMKKMIPLLLVLSILSAVSCVSPAAMKTTKPQTFGERLQGKCYDLEGMPITLSSDYYLVYYAADWCPHCEEYALQLKSTYELLVRMYGNVEIIFAGHERDVSNDNLVSFMKQGGYAFPYIRYEYRDETGIMKLVDVPKFLIPGFVLVDKYGKVLSSSNGSTAEEYSRDRPIQYYQALQQCDCVSDVDWVASSYPRSTH